MGIYRLVGLHPRRPRPASRGRGVGETEEAVSDSMVREPSNSKEVRDKRWRELRAKGKKHVVRYSDSEIRGHDENGKPYGEITWWVAYPRLGKP